jgi:hypothetical protein
LQMLSTVTRGQTNHPLPLTTPTLKLSRSNPDSYGSGVNVEGDLLGEVRVGVRCGVEIKG